MLKSSLVIRRISGGGGNGVYRDRDRAHMGCGRRLVVSGEVIYGYATVANGWAEEVRPNPGQVAVMISPGDEYSQLARTPAQRIGDTTVPKLKQETEQACKL